MAGGAGARDDNIARVPEIKWGLSSAPAFHQRGAAYLAKG